MCVGSAVYTDFLVDEELRHSHETIVERVRHLSLEIVGRDRNAINQIGQTRTGGTAEGGVRKERTRTFVWRWLASSLAPTVTCPPNAYLTS